MEAKKLIGYVGTKDLGTLLDKDAIALDIINIAFAHIKDHKVFWDELDHTSELERIRELNPSIKILLSVGGWSCGGFSEMAANEDTRAIFIESAIDILEQYQLDGIDLDWEYPCYTIAGIEGGRDDRENFTLLLKGLREAFDCVNKEYKLTIAAGGGAYYLKGVETNKIVPYLDYIQLMTYDLRGGYQILTGHHTNLYSPEFDVFNWSVEDAVEAFYNEGVPYNKLVLGAAFYSRMWKGVPDVDHGYLQMADTIGTYGPSYGVLLDEYINKNGYVRYWDDTAKAPFLYNGDTFISYDDEESIEQKLLYMEEKGLYGAMYWEYCLDDSKTLTTFMKSNFR